MVANWIKKLLNQEEINFFIIINTKFMKIDIRKCYTDLYQTEEGVSYKQQIKTIGDFAGQKITLLPEFPFQI